MPESPAEVTQVAEGWKVKDAVSERTWIFETQADAETMAAKIEDFYGEDWRCLI